MAVVESNCVSDAWTEAVQVVSDLPGNEASPLVVSIRCDSTGRAQQYVEFRRRLDDVLESNGLARVETVARTIFPIGLWNPDGSREEFFARYLKILPKLRKCPKNKRGQYFERLVGFQRGRDSVERFNQLEHVIQTYAGGNHRRSALQASLVNPFLDWNNSRRLGFPCLHQVSFIPNGEERSLKVVAYYPLHYLFERAYGNYLGLIWLGEFMAHEMSLRLERVICFAGVAKLEVSKNIVAPLIG